MRVYDSIEAFRTNLGHVRKWMRCGQAIDEAARLPLGAAYSLGDSLTFWTDAVAALAGAGGPEAGRFVGHRRYHAVLCPLDGPLTLRVAPKTSLAVAEPYDDTTDREWFAPPAADSDAADAVAEVTLNPGAVLILEEDEALAVPASPANDPDARVTVVHVTVEGFTFPNK